MVCPSLIIVILSVIMRPFHLNAFISQVSVLCIVIVTKNVQRKPKYKPKLQLVEVMNAALQQLVCVPL